MPLIRFCIISCVKGLLATGGGGGGGGSLVAVVAAVAVVTVLELVATTGLMLVIMLLFFLLFFLLRGGVAIKLVLYNSSSDDSSANMRLLRWAIGSIAVEAGGAVSLVLKTGATVITEDDGEAHEFLTVSLMPLSRSSS